MIEIDCSTSCSCVSTTIVSESGFKTFYNNHRGSGTFTILISGLLEEVLPIGLELTMPGNNLSEDALSQVYESISPVLEEGGENLITLIWCSGQLY